MAQIIGFRAADVAVSVPNHHDNAPGQNRGLNYANMGIIYEPDDSVNSGPYVAIFVKVNALGTGMTVSPSSGARFQVVYDDAPQRITLVSQETAAAGNTFDGVTIPQGERWLKVTQTAAGLRFVDFGADAPTAATAVASGSTPRERFTLAAGKTPVRVWMQKDE